MQSEIERELRGGVRRHRPAVWRVRRPAAGSLITVFSAFVTLGVALAAILLLAHTRTHAPEAGGSRADDGLIGKLAVLRRPQTTADRLPASVRRAAAQRGGGAVIQVSPVGCHHTTRSPVSRGQTTGWRHGAVLESVIG